MLSRIVKNIWNNPGRTSFTKINREIIPRMPVIQVTTTASLFYMCMHMSTNHKNKNDHSNPLTETKGILKVTNNKNKKNIVIIGGGIAGHQIAYSLKDISTINVTLIDPKTYMEIPMAIPRIYFNPELSKKAHIPYEDFLPNVDRVRGHAVGITKDVVTVKVLGENQQLTIPYDYAVIATGVSYTDDLLKPHQGNIEDRNIKIKQMEKELKSANDILIIGGGPVGVEMAAEIRETWPKKNITLVQSQQSLLPGTSKKSISHATKHLTNNKVKILFGTKIIDTAHEGQALAITDKGDKIYYDMVINCCNAKPNTDFIKQEFPFFLDKTGRVIVDKNLSIRGSENRIFAVGDITNLDESRIALWATMHAAVVTTNIKSLLKGKEASSVYKAATGKEMMIVTLGKENGAACLPFGSVTSGWFVNRLKPNFFMSHYRKNIGLQNNPTENIGVQANNHNTAINRRAS